MIRPKSLLSFGVSIALILLPFDTFGRGRNNPTYDGKVHFGAQLLHLDEGCVYIDGALTSGDFFQNLERLDKGDYFEFRKAGQAVTQYPGELTASIRVMGNQCGANAAGKPSAIFRGNSYSLRFEMAWKDGLNVRPASFSGEPSCSGFNSITIPDKGYAIPTISCQLHVNADGVPLGQHLIVLIYSTDGQQITRISAGP